MKFLILFLVAACVEGLQDLSGKMFTFPQQTNRAHVRLNTTVDGFSAATVCHRSFTDLKRDHVLFSLATPSSFNDFLVFYDFTNREIEPHVKYGKSEYGGLDYKPNVWHSICTTWDSQSGLVQLWFNGLPLVRKLVSTGTMGGRHIIILGQEQDAYGGKFDINQCFVGMMTDVHMWDYVVSACEIQKYVNELSFTPGNALNWAALDFQIIDKVLIESKQMTCS